MAAFDDAAFLWDPAIGNSKSHDLVDDVDPSNATDGDTGSDGDGDFRTYNAVGKYARFSTRTGATSTGNKTYMVALKVPTSGTNYLLGHNDVDQDVRYEQLSILDSGNAARMQVRSVSIATATDSMPSLGTFTVLVGTVERPGEGVNLYINGTEVGATSTSIEPGSIDRLSVGRLDRLNPVASNDVQIYAAAFWNRLLSDAEIAEITANPQAYLGGAPAEPEILSDPAVETDEAHDGTLSTELALTSDQATEVTEAHTGQLVTELVVVSDLAEVVEEAHDGRLTVEPAITTDPAVEVDQAHTGTLEADTPEAPELVSDQAVTVEEAHTGSLTTELVITSELAEAVEEAFTGSLTTELALVSEMAVEVDEAPAGELSLLDPDQHWWVPDPVAHTKNPVAFTRTPVGYTPKT